jgi:hypothetical protein
MRSYLFSPSLKYSLSTRCDLLPDEQAVWWSAEYVGTLFIVSGALLQCFLQCLKLSAVAAQVLDEEKLINIHTLEIHRKEANYDCRRTQITKLQVRRNTTLALEPATQ